MRNFSLNIFVFLLAIMLHIGLFFALINMKKPKNAPNDYAKNLTQNIIDVELIKDFQITGRDKIEEGKIVGSKTKEGKVTKKPPVKSNDATKISAKVPPPSNKPKIAKPAPKPRPQPKPHPKLQVESKPITSKTPEVVKEVAKNIAKPKEIKQISEKKENTPKKPIVKKIPPASVKPVSKPSGEDVKKPIKKIEDIIDNIEKKETKESNKKSPNLPKPQDLQDSQDLQKTQANSKTQASGGTLSSKKATETGGNFASSISESSLIASQIYSCWHLPAGFNEADEAMVRVKINLHETGKVIKTEILSQKFGENITARIRQTFTESTIRAIYKCSPFEYLPVERYEKWREIIFNFSPQNI